MKILAMFCSSALLAGMSCVSAPASAVILDFEELANPDGLRGLGPTYSVSGYVFTYTPGPESQRGEYLFIVGASWQYNTGSTAILANRPGARTTLSRDDGRAFDLRTIDLAELNGPGATTVTFEGVRAGGGEVTRSFSLDGITGFESFSFGDVFEGVTEVRWVQGNFKPLLPHMIDNVDVDVAAAPVPEAGTWGLFGTGLALLAGCRKLRSRRISSAPGGATASLSAAARLSGVGPT